MRQLQFCKYVAKMRLHVLLMKSASAESWKCRKARVRNGTQCSMIGAMKKYGRSFVQIFLLASLLLTALAACNPADSSRPSARNAVQAPTSAVDAPGKKPGSRPMKFDAADLPAEARHTLALIKSNGPFPFPKDGSVFGNRERLLPAKPRGYYREYTVITPGSRNRGARRIVAGRNADYYYTDDHYGSFKRIRE